MLCPLSSQSLFFPSLKSSALQALGTEANLRLATQAPTSSSFLVNVALCGTPADSVIGLCYCHLITCDATHHEHHSVVAICESL